MHDYDKRPSQPYNNTRMEYWTTAVKLIGFFFAGLIIIKTGMQKPAKTPE